MRVEVFPLPLRAPGEGVGGKGATSCASTTRPPAVMGRVAIEGEKEEEEEEEDAKTWVV